MSGLQASMRASGRAQLRGQGHRADSCNPAQRPPRNGSLISTFEFDCISFTTMGPRRSFDSRSSKRPTMLGDTHETALRTAFKRLEIETKGCMQVETTYLLVHLDKSEELAPHTYDMLPVCQPSCIHVHCHLQAFRLCDRTDIYRANEICQDIVHLLLCGH